MMELEMKVLFVARGFIPAGARSGPIFLGLLRSPAGTNPLATKSILVSMDFLDKGMHP
ncbi:hypothetical protein SRABI112_00462 [Pseudomonas mediterranea]|uniref:Uncharacterized protein n=1 Tax=Pseudomonas mediterranea TaxID=183795 RepID=A0AAX2D9P5_9PSED|nr:hypothetical protein SRABI112_00462 [Pseudomonas mediterranea]SDU39216.1 hypothetical protein SAMN05216476_1818 [Pseudomonas mediterranea]